MKYLKILEWLDISVVLIYNDLTSCDRGASGVLYLQSATAGAMFSLRALTVRSEVRYVVLRIGSCAMKAFEPCQVRKEAALRKYFHVPRGCLI